MFFRDVTEEKVTPNWTPVAPETPCLQQASRRQSAIGWLREGWRRRRTRLYLTQLDERMLKDIGVTRVEAAREAAKPFWLP
ncbi:MAG: DUF1127 domain-containing protein [Alphaproteobacteria bacterium]|nr:DUF1127 domain-containing protein [Alphaproteobacteria bacterium]